VKVYITYWDKGIDGLSRPVRTFSSQADAVEWCSIQRSEGSVSVLHLDPRWVELEVDDECS
jgi:hypothetical protein